MPPTTPPAIAAAFDEPEPPVVEELGPDDVADGVPSGLSFNREEKEKKLGVFFERERRYD